MLRKARTFTRLAIIIRNSGSAVLRPGVSTILAAVVLVLVLSGCAIHRLPSAEQYEMIKSGQRSIWPQRLTELVDRRWAPALTDLAPKAGWSEADVDHMLSTAGHYFLEGPRRGFDLGPV